MKGGCGRLRGCFSSASLSVCPFSCTTHGVSQPQQPRKLSPFFRLCQRREGTHQQLQRYVCLHLSLSPALSSLPLSPSTPTTSFCPLAFVSYRSSPSRLLVATAKSSLLPPRRSAHAFGIMANPLPPQLPPSASQTFSALPRPPPSVLTTPDTLPHAMISSP